MHQLRQLWLWLKPNLERVPVTVAAHCNAPLCWCCFTFQYESITTATVSHSRAGLRSPLEEPSAAAAQGGCTRYRNLDDVSAEAGSAGV